MAIPEPFKPPDHASSFTSSENMSNGYATIVDEDGSDLDDRRDNIDVSRERRGARRNTRSAVATNHGRPDHHETDGESDTSLNEWQKAMRAKVAYSQYERQARFHVFLMYLGFYFSTLNGSSISFMRVCSRLGLDIAYGIQLP